MANIFGHLNVSDSDYAYNTVVGQQVIFQAATDYLNRINQELAAASSIFVAGRTEAFKQRYYLPGGGYLQPRAKDGRYGAVKADGSWDVAFPLRDYGAMIAGNDVDMAYMTIGELNRHIQNITIKDVNTYRREILRALFYSAQETFSDDIHGDLSVEPLANGDSTLYPPVIGSNSEATEDHYLGTAYIATAIDDTHDPYETYTPDLTHHFSQAAEGEPVIAFINADETPETIALTDFYQVSDGNLRVGSGVTVPVALPANVPGRILGRHNAGCWVSEWGFVPSGYILFVHLGAEPPLLERVDPAATGLGAGLQLVASNEEFPFQESIWRHRFGLGCGNRLNGIAIHLSGASTYTDPTIS